MSETNEYQLAFPEQVAEVVPAPVVKPNEGQRLKLIKQD